MNNALQAVSYASQYQSILARFIQEQDFIARSNGYQQFDNFQANVVPMYAEHFATLNDLSQKCLLSGDTETALRINGHMSSLIGQINHAFHRN